MIFQSIVHYSLHYLAIGAIAYWYDKEKWKRYWLILALTMLVDLDHGLATPYFDAQRCGIGYHPLHSEIAIAIYVAGIFLLKNKLLKLISIGLFFHMITDFIDCLWMFSKCNECYLKSEVYHWIHFFRN